ncbi:MAG: dihydropteroate synthase [Myxococcota bacterium]
MRSHDATDDASYVPRILGVLNVSPESMVSESIAEGDDAVARRAAQLAATGADWIDLGGRSITPDAPMIGDDTEQARLGPALALLKAEGSEHFRERVSVDTWSPATAHFALEHGADGVNYTGGPLPPALLETVAAKGATLFITFMPYADAYAMRSAPPAAVGLQAVLDHLGPKVEAARNAGVEALVIDPNLGIIHPTTDDHQKIHQQLEIIWRLDALRTLACPILLYAARKPERLARIMTASACLHARADYIRTHTPEMIWRLHGPAASSAPGA